MNTIPPSTSERKRMNPWRRYQGVFIPNWLLERKATEISQGAKLCYGVLCRFAGRNGYCWPSQEKISEVLGSSLRQTQRHLQELADLHLVEVERRGHMKTSRYYFLEHAWEGDNMAVQETTDTSGHDTTDTADRRESREENQRREEETPSARNLNSSGEKMAAWEDFLDRLSSLRREGIESPIVDPDSYARKCSQNGSWPPDVDLHVLFETARAVKIGMGRKVVILPGFEEMHDTATYFKKCREVAKEDFHHWLVWASDRVEVLHGSLGDDRLLLHALTQAGVLAPFSEWEASRAVATPA